MSHDPLQKPFPKHEKNFENLKDRPLEALCWFHRHAPMAAALIAKGTSLVVGEDENAYVYKVHVF